MDPEDSENPDHKGGHQHERPIKHGLLFRIGMGRMGDELNEVGVGAGVALSTGLYQTFL